MKNSVETGRLVAKEEDLTPNFFDWPPVALGEPDVEVTQAAPIRGFKTGSSIVTELTARKVNKLVGHFPFVLTYKNRSGATQNLDVMAKLSRSIARWSDD